MSLTSQQTIKITPWRDAKELNDTLSNLMTSASLFSMQRSNDGSSSTSMPAAAARELQHLYRAIQMVSVWRARCSTHLPHAVDTMGYLSELVLRDYYVNILAATKIRQTKASDGTDADSSSPAEDIINLPFRAIGCMELRLAYSAAIIRGVNGLTDAALNPYKAQSVHTLACKLDLPNWLVNVRHDASHNELPTLSCLRICATTLLQWLNDRYHVPLHLSRDNEANRALKLLHQYNDHAKQSEWDKCNHLISEKFIKLPIDIGYIALLNYFVLRGLDESKSIQYVKGGVGGAFIPSSSIAFSDEIFRNHRQLYTPLLRQVLQRWNGFLNCLLNCLVDQALLMEKWTLDTKEKVTEKELRRQVKFLLAWIRFFATDIKVLKLFSVEYSFKEAKNIQKCFIQSHLPLKHLLSRCEEIYFITGGSASHELIDIFKHCLSKKNISSKRGKFQHEVSNLQEEKEIVDNSTPNMTLEDLEGMLTSSSENEDETFNKPCESLQKRRRDTTEDYTQSDNPWSLCESWEKCPIGLVPGEFPR